MKLNKEEWNSILLYEEDIKSNLVNLNKTNKNNILNLKKNERISMGLMGFPSKISQVIDAKIYVMLMEHNKKEYGIIIVPKTKLILNPKQNKKEKEDKKYSLTELNTVLDSKQFKEWHYKIYKEPSIAPPMSRVMLFIERDLTLTQKILEEV